MANDIQILNEYPKDQYNNLIPVTTFQEVSDLQKVVVNQVKLDFDNDTYPESGKRALKKNALLKLMSAANIKIIDSRPITPSTTEDAIRMAKAIGKVVEYDKRDVAHQVTVQVTDVSGAVRTYTGTKEIIVADIEDSNMSDKQKAQMIKFRREQCETKAMLRAIRNALSIKATYDSKELQKPFIVAITVPNTDNPEIRKALTQKYSQATAALFDSPDQSPQLMAPEVEQREIVEADEIIDDPDEFPDFLNGGADVIDPNECSQCGEQITGSAKVSKDEVIAKSQEHFGESWCLKCMNEHARNGGN